MRPSEASISASASPIDSRSAVASTSNGEIERGIDGNFARRRILDDDEAAGCLDMPRSCRAVPAAAGQDHGHESRAVRPRSRLEDAVDGRRDRPDLGRSQHHRVVDDVHEPIAGDDEDDAVLEPVAVLGGPDRERRVTMEDVTQVARPAGIEVLGDDDGRGEVRRQPGDDPESASTPPADEPMTTSCVPCPFRFPTFGIL